MRAQQGETTTEDSDLLQKNGKTPVNLQTKQSLGKRSIDPTKTESAGDIEWKGEQHKQKTASIKNEKHHQTLRSVS